MARAYYNEIDPKAAAWLRELIKQGHIAQGDVDERSIADVAPADLDGYTQCHFFAGIGVWSYALRRAGWPDERPVWTGSCPCQPFSAAAGKGGGFDDERHLWPVWFRLIAERRPGVVFGEQVASKDGLAWLDLVQSDLEGEDYACGALDLCAAGVGAPHIRQRLFFVGDTFGQKLEGHGWDACAAGGWPLSAGSAATASPVGELANLYSHGCSEAGGNLTTAGGNGPLGDGPASRLADAEGFGRAGWPHDDDSRRRQLASGPAGEVGGPRPTNGFWRDADWLGCRDGKWRAVEPGTFPLAHGAPARVGRLRGYGNAIVAPVAEEFVRAYLSL